MKKYGILMAVLVGALACGSEEVEWLSYEEGMEKVKEKRKPAIIDLFADWCYWCKVMDTTTFEDTKIVNELTRNYICIRLDPDKYQKKIRYKHKEYEPHRFIQALGVRGFPSIVFMDKNGELITLLPGYTDAKTLLPVLHYVQKECYKKKVTFEEYKKTGKCR